MHPGRDAKKFHPAAGLEELVWGSMSVILSDPENLRSGLGEMIERERSRSAGDPDKETAALKRRLGEIKGRRARYQEMATADLVDFDELRERLAGLDEARGTPSGRSAPPASAPINWSAWSATAPP